jgi:hypothetical protein
MLSAFLIGAKMFAGNALGAVWRFLKGASAWQLIALALAGLCIILWFQRNDARSDAARWEKQAAGFKAQLDSISTKRNVQHDVTERTVTKVVRGDPVVRKIVQVIHDAPNPPDCKTPGLDVARAAL